MLKSIHNPWPGGRLVYRARTASTMQDARRLARAGFPPGTVAVAGFQEAGRGRLAGRTWFSPPGDNLLFTLLLRRPLPVPLTRLPILAGLAVALALEDLFGLSPRIKWPNDILLHGRKLCGVLGESFGEHVLLGVGLNCNQEEFPPELADRAVSLRQNLGRTVDPASVLERVLFRLHDGLEDGDWKERVLRRLHLLDFPVRILQDERGVRQTRGTLAGLDDDGALLLCTDRSEPPVRIVSGELQADL